MRDGIFATIFVEIFPDDILFRCAERPEVSLAGKWSPWRGGRWPRFPGVESGQAGQPSSQQHVRDDNDKSQLNYKLVPAIARIPPTHEPPR